MRKGGGREAPAVALARQVRRQGAAELHDRHPPLGHAVALADRHLLVLEALKVNRHAVWRADLVLPAVALADVAARVVVPGQTERADALRDLVRPGPQRLLFGERR